jgi:hypothetical protein
MQRRRFAPSEARDGPDRSESVDGFGEAMKADEPDDNEKMEYEMNSPDFQPQQDPHGTPRLASTPAGGRHERQDSPAHDSELPGLDARAENIIYDLILEPLFDQDDFQCFDPIMRACRQKIQAKEIVCLRDLEHAVIGGALLVSSLSLLRISSEDLLTNFLHLRRPRI